MGVHMGEWASVYASEGLVGGVTERESRRMCVHMGEWASVYASEWLARWRD
jgi:hypothetical protein